MGKDGAGGSSGPSRQGDRSPIRQAFLEFEKLPGGRVITPGLLELVYSKTCL